MQTITVVTTQDEKTYLSHCLEYDIASQGSTRKEALDNIKEAVSLFLECASPAEVQARTVVVPKHKELRRGTLSSIIRQSELPREAFD